MEEHSRKLWRNVDAGHEKFPSGKEHNHAKDKISRTLETISSGDADAAAQNAGIEQ